MINYYSLDNGLYSCGYNEPVGNNFNAIKAAIGFNVSDFTLDDEIDTDEKNTFSNFKKLGFVKKGHIVSVAVLEEYRKL